MTLSNADIALISLPSAFYADGKEIWQDRIWTADEAGPKSGVQDVRNNGEGMIARIILPVIKSAAELFLKGFPYLSVSPFFPV